MHCSCNRLRAQFDTRVSRRAGSLGRMICHGKRLEVVCDFARHSKQYTRVSAQLHWHQAGSLSARSAAVQTTAAENCACIQADGNGAADVGSSNGNGNKGNGNNSNGRKRTVDGDGEDCSRLGSCRTRQLLHVLLSVLLPSMLLQLVNADVAVAWGRSQVVAKKDERMLPGWEIDAFVDRMWDLSGPILNNMGFSGLVGAASAAALKWVGRTLAASVGMALILVQVLSYYNVVTVNWSVVHQQAAQVLDRTGDGRLDQDDFKRMLKKSMIILSEGVPSVSGFLVGFIIGLKVL